VPDRCRVGDLVAEQDQRNIGLSGSGMARLWIGQELHAASNRSSRMKIPATARGTTFAELEIDGWTLALSAVPTRAVCR